jgi:hypothetical protein
LPGSLLAAFIAHSLCLFPPQNAAEVAKEASHRDVFQGGLVRLPVIVFGQQPASSCSSQSVGPLFKLQLVRLVLFLGLVRNLRSKAVENGLHNMVC